MLNSQIPAKFNIPFANAAAGGYIRPIPQASQIGTQDGAASLTDGFPPICFLDVGAGGVPMFGQDVNGLLNQMTAWIRWTSAGGPVPYDGTFQTAIGGYPSGAMVGDPGGGGWWLSTADNNLTNPTTGGAGWVLMTAPKTYNVGGSANAITITSPTPAPAGYTDGMQYVFVVGTKNTGAVTIAAGTAGAVGLVRNDGAALKANDLQAGAIVAAQYVAALNVFAVRQTVASQLAGAAASTGLEVTSGGGLDVAIHSLALKSVDLADEILIWDSVGSGYMKTTASAVAGLAAFAATNLALGYFTGLIA